MAHLLRKVIEDEIERLIGLLDHVDGDWDLEEGGDLETSLGGRAVRLPDGQLVDDAEGDTSDDEWSLGWGFHVRAHGAANMANSCDLEQDVATV